MHNRRIYTHSQAKSNNRATVLKLICTGEADSRATLSRETGLSKMAISNIVAELIEDGLIREIGRNPSNPSSGRRPVKIELSEESPYVAGIFISRNECGVVICDMAARIHRHRRLDLPIDFSTTNLQQALLGTYNEITGNLDRPVIGVGIASIGPIDKANGIILNPPDFNGIHDLAIRGFFENQLKLPVFFDNNMNASVLAEKLYGRGKGLSNIIYLGVLRGIGAGVISKGNLLEGSTGIIGEIGHTSIKFDGPMCQCGNRGCLELYASIPKIVENTARKMIEANVSTQEIFDWTQLVELARQGDYYCIRALEQLCSYLTVGIVNLVNLFDCEEIFLGHDIALAEGLIEKQLEDEVNKRIFATKIKKIRISMSAFGQYAPLVGAACLVLENIFSGRITSGETKKELLNEEVTN